MMDDLGRMVLESGATPYELALADTEAEQIIQIEAELVAANWDPYKVQARNLLFLAFAMGVQLWDDDWPEETKRYWIAEQWRFKAIRGTEPAFKMALGLWGYELAEVVTPPQGFYASEDFTTAERNAWISQMPTLRIRRYMTHGYGHVDEWFAGQSFAGEAFATPDDAWLLYSRRGFLRRDGVDTPLDTEQVSTTVTNGTVTDVERISLTGRSTQGFFAGVDFAGDKFAGAAEVEAQLVTVSKVQDFITVEKELSLTTAKPGLEPLEQGFTQESEVGDGGWYFYAGADFAGDAFTADDNASDMLVDVMHLFDPAVALPMVEGASFAGVDRSGMEPKTAELLVDLKLKAEPLAWFAGVSFVGEAVAIPEDERAMDNALRACEAAKALRDTILVSFAPRRPLRWGDDIQENTKAGAWVRDHL